MSSVLKERPEVLRGYNGLSQKEAEARLSEYGYNEISQTKKITAISIFLSQFKDFMVMVLLVATLISFLLGETVDAIAIVTIVIMNAILGFIQEYRTEKSLEALKELSAPHAIVIRDGQEKEIQAREIVPGDLIVLEAGDIVPADCLLIEGVNIQVNESILTGESVPVEKMPSQALSDKNKLFMGTTLTAGRGKAVVSATGMRTEMGSIAHMIQNVEKESTPLEQRLDKIGKQLVYICLGICGIIFLLGIYRGESVHVMLLSATSLAVAAIPEGLPAIVTVTLALGVQRMLKRNALVRKLPAVETLGCINIICSDKTGTLTENKMTVKKIYTNGQMIDTSDSDYSSQANKNAALKQLLIIGALCNNAEYRDGKIIGDPTEVAILAASRAGGISKENLSGYRYIAEIPFDSDRKRMSVIYQDYSGNTFVFVKGAPDVILDLCSKKLDDNGLSIMSYSSKRKIMAVTEEMASQALRVIGFAYKKLERVPQNLSSPDIEKNLTFVGLEGMIDPPRPETIQSIKSCYRAGIKPIMITGDHKVTAVAIAKEIGMKFEPGDVMTGEEIEAMDDRELEKKAESVSVFARVSPRHKYKIVRALKKNSRNIVAMTGDGVNDAPALKEANIGVAMGKSGTDVAKEASSMVLLDDNFATIVEAIREGRIIYDNIRKFLRYLLSCNLGEIVAMAAAALFAMPAPLIPIQILWINLVTDGLPALALSADPPDDDIMSRPPRENNESIFSRGLGARILMSGFLIGVSTITAFALMMYMTGGDIEMARTVAFATLIMAELIYAFESRSEHKDVWEAGLFANKYLVLAVLSSFAFLLLAIYNPFLSSILKTRALGASEWMIVLGFSLLEFAVTSLLS